MSKFISLTEVITTTVETVIEIPKGFDASDIDRIISHSSNTYSMYVNEDDEVDAVVHATNYHDPKVELQTMEVRSVERSEDQESLFTPKFIKGDKVPSIGTHYFKKRN